MKSIKKELPEFRPPSLEDSGIRDDVLLTDPVWLYDKFDGWLVGIGFKTKTVAWWEFLQKRGQVFVNDDIITHWQPIERLEQGDCQYRQVFDDVYELLDGVAKTMDDTIWFNTGTTAHEALIELAAKYNPALAVELEQKLERE